jgi:hypothetical protein
MAYSLNRLKTLLRMKLGEPEEGAFTSSTQYADESSTVDELALYLNQGQKEVAMACVRMGNALLVGQQLLTVEANTHQYALPDDLLSVLDLFHLHDGIYYRLDQRSVRSMRDRFDPQATGSVYDYYDVFGSTAKIKYEGIVTATYITPETSFQHALTNLDLTVNRDIVFNLTDNSRAIVADYTSTPSVMVTQPLVGGKTNQYNLNDRIQIESGEQTLQLLHCYPPIDAGNTQTLVSANSTTSSFTPTVEGVLHSIKLTFSTAPTGPLRVQVQRVGTADYYYASIDNPGTSAEAVFPYGTELYATQYDVYYSDANGSVVTPATLEVVSYTGSESLELHYARYPQEMSSTTPNFELPDWSANAVVAHAAYAAQQKLFGGASNQSAQAKAEYELEVIKIKEFMNIQHKDRVGQVKDVITSGAYPTHKNVPINIRLPLK